MIGLGTIKGAIRSLRTCQVNYNEVIFNILQQSLILT